MNGARPLNRLIQTKILNPIATKIIAEEVKAGDRVSVDEVNGELVIASQGRKSPLSAKNKVIV